MFTISDKTDLSKLSEYMFINFNKNLKVETKSKSIELDIKKPNIYIDYNKQKCKYNEKPTYNIEDKLFWYLYIKINDITIYDIINENKFILEKQTKIEYSKKLKDNISIIKQNKIKRTILESDLINSDVISLYSFISLLIIYNIPSIIIFDHSYTLTHIDNKSNSKCIRLKKNNKSYDIEEVTDIDKNEIINKYYFIENINKPIKSFSSMRINDLLNITTKLGLSHIKNNIKKNKKMLYDDIVEKLKI